MSRRIFVPVLVDEANRNPQVNNVRELLARWQADDWRIDAMRYGEADPRVCANPQVTITRLWRRHLWYLHMFLCYFKPFDMIFYPGVHRPDFFGLRWRRRLWRVPVLGTIEGLVGNAAWEQQYSAWAGHAVYCQPVAEAQLARLDEHYRHVDHVIAISPFLARMGARRYGDKFSVLPLGINPDWFHAGTREPNARLQVVAVGGVRAHKRPHLLLTLAQRFPHADFTWYGDGELRAPLQQQAAREGLDNVRFAGPLAPRELGAALRAADLFVLPSLSEGVPKVTQEAAACGLAQVIFGHYEAPSVIDGSNGCVVFDDESFCTRVGELLADRALLERYGRCGAAMAQDWSWEKVAPRWRDAVLRIATAGEPAR